MSSAIVLPRGAGPGDGPDRDDTVAQTHKDFRTTTDDLMVIKVEKVEEGRWVHPAQGAV